MHDVQEPVVSEADATRSRSVPETLEYAIRLAQALRRMHEEGVVCGHLHPSQIVAQGDGLAIHRNGDHAGVTPYTAPELLQGRAPDTRSDIFAFGTIVYEFLSGRRVFPAEDPEALKRQILEHEPALPEGNSEGIPRLLRRCLEKKPENRWQRISSVLIELKLASATSRSTQQVSEWKERMSSLENHIADLERRLAVQDRKADQQGAEIAKAAEAIAAVEESAAVAQKMAHAQNLAIESIQTGLSQTDEVLEHMADALGLIHKSMVERAEANLHTATPGH